jgi:DNA-binding IclR family transcriptional regulator
LVPKGEEKKTMAAKKRAKTRSEEEKATAKKAPRGEKPAKTRKPSALDAAAKVLRETGEAMNSKELIAAMAAKGYWTSPGGKTPHATLYAAMLREINQKGKETRFKKAERGKFALATREA